MTVWCRHMWIEQMKIMLYECELQYKGINSETCVALPKSQFSKSAFYNSQVQIGSPLGAYVINYPSHTASQSTRAGLSTLLTENDPRF